MEKQVTVRGTEKHKFRLSVVWIATLLFVIATIVLMVFFVQISSQVEQDIDQTEYGRYYAMIVNDRDSEFWRAVYAGAQEAGRNRGVFVELLGENLSQRYGREDLMRIAIAASVDGIILEADESPEMRALIDEATEQGISVVTLYTDNAASNRVSYVGISNYNLGKEYGAQVLKIAQERAAADISVRDEQLKVMVMVSQNANDAGQNILYSGIQETIDKAYGGHSEGNGPIDVSLMTVDDTNEFSVEESVRSLFIQYRDKLPDIIICLDEITTASAYQAVVDYNKVGSVSILGYYDSGAILKAVERGVIYATASIDTAQMGRACVDALTEYEEYGNTSQYFTADVTIIDRTNISNWTKKEVED